MPASNATDKSLTQGLTPGSRISHLLRESRWLAGAGAAAYLVLILATYHRADPAWSHSAAAGLVRNAGGRIGAIGADVLLYLFGFSAWWLVALLCYVIIAAYKRLGHSHNSDEAGMTLLDRRSMFAIFGGFALLLTSSAALEALRFHTLKAQLPLQPGGMLGELTTRFADAYFGFTGATLLLLLGLAIGLSLFTGISWLAVAERIGAVIEKGVD